METKCETYWSRSTWGKIVAGSFNFNHFPASSNWNMFPYFLILSCIKENCYPVSYLCVFIQVEDPFSEATKYLKLLQKNSPDSLETLTFFRSEYEKTEGFACLFGKLLFKCVAERLLFSVPCLIFAVSIQLKSKY